MAKQVRRYRFRNTGPEITVEADTIEFQDGAYKLSKNGEVVGEIFETVTAWWAEDLSSETQESTDPSINDDFPF